MADYSEAIVHDWWVDLEFNEYCAIIETVDGELRFLFTPKKEEPK